MAMRAGAIGRAASMWEMARRMSCLGRMAEGIGFDSGLLGGVQAAVSRILGRTAGERQLESIEVRFW